MCEVGGDTGLEPGLYLVIGIKGYAVALIGVPAFAYYAVFVMGAQGNVEGAPVVGALEVYGVFLGDAVSKRHVNPVG